MTQPPLPPGAKADPANAPKIGMVSLGCPKALVDSERILTGLRSEGYGISPDYAGADVVLVNTCGFLDTAKAESLDAIGEAIAENGRVIVTGCLGKDADFIRERHPNVLAVTGPQQYEQVIQAVHAAAPQPHDPYVDLVPPQGIRLTPRHYAYVKISEGCNHSCRFCIIPSMRGKLASRPAAAILYEAEKLAAAGVKELLVISQDTSAYGVDINYATSNYRGEPIKARFTELVDALGRFGIWVRLHYVYPYPHVDEVMPLMADGRVLPYLDIPFQHGDPEILKRMRRPAAQEKTLERIARWRAQVPELTLRSTFIVGFPGETDRHFENLLGWLEEAQLDRVGCFKYEPVAGAAANDLDGQVPEAVKEERWHRFMQTQQQISARRLAEKVGQRIEVLIDEVDEEGAIGRSRGDAPEIDGAVYLNGDTGLMPGDLVTAQVEESDDTDLWAVRVD